MRANRLIFAVLGPVAGFLLGWQTGTLAGPFERAGAHAASTSEVEAPIVLAAPGRIEGVSDRVHLAAGIDGVLSAVLFDEGDRVEAGDVVAVVQRDELRAELDQARAAADGARQAKARLVRGSREEERRQAAAEAMRAEAALATVETHLRRQELLLRTDDTPRAVVEQARHDFDSADAALRAARATETLVNAEPLPEELAKADAEIEAAEQRIRTIESLIAKCRVRAPIGGSVVRRFMRPGEVVSTVMPQPILSIVDDSKLRVRAEVDERDLGRVVAGQAALLSADAFGDRKLHGRVSSLGIVMGRKNVLTGDPAEKSDRDILEVFVELEETDPRLVLGLRVTVQFLDGTPNPPAETPQTPDVSGLFSILPRL